MNQQQTQIPQQTVIEYVHGKRRFSHRLMRQVMSLALAEARNKARIEASRSNAADKKQYEETLFNEAQKELNRRLGNNRSPRGILVAVKVSDTEFSIGHASCRKNERFNRDRALEIALGRAFAGFDPSTASYEVEQSLPEFITRCKKYYKGLSLAFKPIRVGQPGVLRGAR